MKKNIILFNIVLVLILNQLKLKCQEYQSLPDSNASWIVHQDNGWGGLYIIKFYLSPNKDDTVIDNKTYTKLYKRFDVAAPQYYGSYRNGENGKSYFYSKYLEEELLLRDFTKETGDTIRDVAYEFDLDWTWKLDFIVDSTNVFFDEQYSYKVMFLNTLVPDTIPEQAGDPLIWIEKIGSFGGGPVNSVVGGLGLSYLNCNQYNDTIFFNNAGWSINSSCFPYQYGECVDAVGQAEFYDKEFNVLIHPNPVSSDLTINLNDCWNTRETSIEIIDLSGKVLILEEQVSMTNIINIEHLTPGIYIVKIHDKELTTMEKVIIK